MNDCKYKFVWQVSYEGAGRDSAGWAYCQVPGLKPDEVQAGTVERQPHSWAPSACAGCVWRRRTWVDHGRLDSMQVHVHVLAWSHLATKLVHLAPY